MQTVPTSSKRSGFVLALIIGLPLAVTMIGLFVAGPFSSGPAAEIPSACSDPFVDGAPAVTSSERVFAEIARVRLFDCGDRFVAVVDGVGGADGAFTAATPSVVASIALIDQYGELHERRLVTSGDDGPSVTSQRGSDQPIDVSSGAVGFDGPALVVVFPRGRGEEVLTRVEVSVSESSGTTTVHDDFAADF